MYIEMFGKHHFFQSCSNSDKFSTATKKVLVNTDSGLLNLVGGFKQFVDFPKCVNSSGGLVDKHIFS